MPLVWSRGARKENYPETARIVAVCFWGYPTLEIRRGVWRDINKGREEMQENSTELGGCSREAPRKEEEGIALKHLYCAS